MSKLRIDVGAVGESVWTSNGMEYENKGLAQLALDKLIDRWFGFNIARIVDVAIPRGEVINLDDPSIVFNERKKVVY